jgi:RHH-type proline utilization regulon transcriptional repressor/proline dehydrogenase/delta 1-pyrroline-5-carboxylate dehydrogenase
VLADTGIPSRIYSPVGSHDDLLPYLVRRLLENGANSSFVNRTADDLTPVTRIIADPRESLRAAVFPHPRIPLPMHLYSDRQNSRGIDLHDVPALTALSSEIDEASARPWLAAPILPGVTVATAAEPVHGPADRRRLIGHVVRADAAAVDAALSAASSAFAEWNRQSVDARARCLERAADLLEARMGIYVALCQREAGKTLPDAVAEVREAVDYCRYYAVRARQDFAPVALPGPTGETNRLVLEGRGVFVCISPWNFPLAIFTGQVVAALVCGNTVVAKPAEQTPLVAAAAVRLLHESGIPPQVLCLLPGDGPSVGAALVRDPRVAGVAFTGGTETARAIERALAGRDAPAAAFVAETGGLNAMLVDSSALPEQVTADVIGSAFQSAGQRCSALRLLLLQDDIADRMITMLAGAMAQLRVDDPSRLASDVGPVIDDAALERLRRHAARMDQQATLIQRCVLPDHGVPGNWFPPVAYEIRTLDQLREEVFGPILHVLRYRREDVDDIIDAVNALGFGLTFGIQSRLDSTIARVSRRVRAGNIYVNRNIIGAVVGTHPLGGMGLSGTGPKAGGPHYLQRFVVEKTISINTTAAGGNATLMTLEDD